MRKALGMVAVMLGVANVGSLRAQGPQPPGGAWKPGEPTGVRGSYVGQTPPGTTPLLFAPGIVSLPAINDGCLTMSSDGSEVYFSRNARIVVSRLGPGGWTFPEPVAFSAGFPVGEGHLTRDNSRFYWLAVRPVPPGQPSVKNVAIWASDRTADGWSPAKYVGLGMFASSTNDGEIYVTDLTENPKGYLARARLADGRFTGFERLKGGFEKLRSEQVTVIGHPAVAPDGSYVVFDLAGEHLFVSFRNSDGTWSDAVDLAQHGIDAAAGLAYVSPDGRYLFFNLHEDIYWVSTKVIEGLRPRDAGAPPDAKTISGRVPVNGGEIYYEARGSGRTVVLLHGGYLDRRMWDAQFDLLARNYRVIRFDARGAGRSSVPTAAFSNYEDLHALLVALGVKKATLVGLSLGGRTAIDFALAHPGMVEGIVAVAPGMSGWAFRDPVLVERVRPMQAAAEANDVPTYIEWFIRSWMDGPRRTPEQVDKTLRDRVKQMAMENWSWRSTSRVQVQEMNAAARIADLNVPILAIVGDQDMSDIHNIVDALVKNVAGAKKVVVSGAGHLVPLEKPAEFNRALLAFLKEK